MFQLSEYGSHSLTFWSPIDIRVPSIGATQMQVLKFFCQPRFMPAKLSKPPSK